MDPAAPVSMLTLQAMQEEVARTWTAAGYSEDYLADRAPHRDFRHAALHAVKAAGMLAALVEELDHEDNSQAIWTLRENAQKYLADLVICALRLANVVPVPLAPLPGTSAGVDLTTIVLRRMQEAAARSAGQVEDHGPFGSRDLPSSGAWKTVPTSEAFAPRPAPLAMPTPSPGRRKP